MQARADFMYCSPYCLTAIHLGLEISVEAERSESIICLLNNHMLWVRVRLPSPAWESEVEKVAFYSASELSKTQLNEMPSFPPCKQWHGDLVLLCHD